uniref:AAA domain-containing protein n=1 Tax=Candidatus Electrothrix sp. TaxID=2170559 RepID=UPI004055ACB9
MSDFTQHSAEKLVRLVRYLRAISTINAKTVRTLEQYNKVFWLPSDAAIISNEQEEAGDSCWLDIKKTELPPPPPPPERCEKWVNQEDLKNLTTPPVLTLPPDVAPGTGNSGQDRSLYAAALARKKKQWQNYIDQQWKPWQQACQRILSSEKIYTELFRLYQEQQKLGEQYELLLCFGLLRWETSKQQLIQRHLIVTEATISFDPIVKRLTVYQGSPAPRVELDMLSLEEQPQDVQQLIQESCQALQGNLHNREKVDAVLKGLANTLNPSEQQPKPVITYAPALIIRKRSAHPLEHFLDEILGQSLSSATIAPAIPEEFLNLCEIVPDETSNNVQKTEQEQIEDRIFFPLPSNQEQRRIVKKLQGKKGVLVQGPPGTGKSHTIANLICHLLAQGKRVLVTAQTTRALQVLNDLLPEDIRPLCFNAAEQGQQESLDLERKIRAILRAEKKQHPAENESIQKLEKHLQEKQEAKQATDKTILNLREQETRHHRISQGRYSGTAAQIAQQLGKEEPAFSWLTDRIPQEIPLPWSDEQLLFLRTYLRTTEPEKEKILQGKELPHLEEKFPVHKVKEAFEKEDQARQAAALDKQRLQRGQGKVLFQTGKADRRKIELIRDQLTVFRETVRDLQQRPMPWITTAVHDVLCGQSNVWQDILQRSQEMLQNIPKTLDQVDRLKVDISWEIDRNKLLQDALALKKHFKAGGRTGKWLFKPEIIRKHGRMLRTITINGQPCTSTESLLQLVNYLQVDEKLQAIWHLWEGRAERSTGHFSLQVSEIKGLLNSLQRVISLDNKRKNLEQELSTINGLDLPDWSDTASVQLVLEDCRSALARLDFLWLRSSITHAQKTLSVFTLRNNAHPITKLVIKSLQKRDIATYEQLFSEIETLKIQAKELARKNQLIDALNDVAPQLAAQLRSGKERKQWADRLGQLKQAWSWAQAKDWVQKFLAHDLESYQRQSQQLTAEMRADLFSLTAAQAWNHFFAQLTTRQHGHMIAWQQAIKKFGKGTGKHAQTHKENARRHLDACQLTLPVCIMPLHRVYETIPAEPGFFDVVIADEASQCGPEALPLLYLGKQILAAGDDKQISPEAVGINREHVQQHMHNFLFDFTHADSFDVDSSLFDHCLLRFTHRIVLQEHFRCMPEIIAFSNSQFYQDDPLVPLRQYLPERLEPLKAILVNEGSRHAQGQQITNPQEAEALVAQVVQCCQDKRYRGKTMGVIVLQGTAQSYLIEELLIKAIGVEEMGQRKLICGNSFSFQGGERDIIFLSMVTAPGQKIRALTRTAEQQKFNVAASRAREQTWLFHSVQEKHLSPECLRLKLIKHFHRPTIHRTGMLADEQATLQEKALLANRTVESPPAPFQSWLEVDLAQRLGKMGYSVVPQYAFAGKKIDLVIQGQQAQLAIACDSDQWQGPEQYLEDLEHQEKLKRCGWQVFRIRASRYYAEPDKVWEPLIHLLDQLKIRPQN